MNKLTSVILALCMMCSLWTAMPVTASAETSGYYTYEVSNDVATIIEVDWDISGDVTIPSTLGGYPVTAIGDWAFLECSGLTSIVVPDSVTIIGESAFDGCYNLTSVELGNSVTTIDNWAFYACESLTSIKIPDSVTIIGGFAFFGCYSLTSVDLGNSVTTIGESAFEYCESLEKIEIPDSVATIGEAAFKSCEGLTNIDITSTVTTIGDGAFAGCSGLTSINVNANNPNYSSQDGILFNKSKTKLIAYPGTKSGAYTVPSSVTTIANEAFSGCKNLTSVNFHSNITVIGDRMFVGCTGLKSIDVNINNTKYSSQDGVLFNKNKTKLIACPSGKSGVYTVPAGVAEIGDSAFYYCTGITSIAIPDSVTAIGHRAFYYCIGITSMVIPNNVTTIGEMAFQTCRNLTSIEISDNVTEIGDMAFRYCESLTNIKIPDSVTAIGEGVFTDCVSLTSVEIGNGVASIGNRAFVRCDYLTNIKIPNSVTEIGNSAFQSCYSLTDVYYIGTEQDWSEILVGSGNRLLTKAAIHYISPKITSFTTQTNGNDVLVNIKVESMHSDATVFVASYGDYENLLELQTPTLTNGEANATFSADGVCSYKAFVWKNESLRPITDLEELIVITG